MKKIFTLLVAVVIFTAANAQYGQGDNRQQGQWNNQQNDQWNNGNNRDVARNDNGYGRDDRYNNGRFGMERRRDMEIARINRDYEFKMDRVRNSFFMGRFEKQRELRFLQEQREREIRRVYYQYGNNSRFDDRHDRDDHDDHGHRGHDHD